MNHEYYIIDGYTGKQVLPPDCINDYWMTTDLEWAEQVCSKLQRMPQHKNKDLYVETY